MRANPTLHFTGVVPAKIVPVSDMALNVKPMSAVVGMILIKPKNPKPILVVPKTTVRTVVWRKFKLDVAMSMECMQSI